jgi:hypothetical protein
MSTKAETQRGHFLFRFSEYGDGSPWISTEPYRTQDRLKDLGDGGFIGFDLKTGATFSKPGKSPNISTSILIALTARCFKKGKFRDKYKSHGKPG